MKYAMVMMQKLSVMFVNDLTRFIFNVSFQPQRAGKQVYCSRLQRRKPHLLKFSCLHFKPALISALNQTGCEAEITLTIMSERNCS